jgi:hypothetical protein
LDGAVTDARAFGDIASALAALVIAGAAVVELHAVRGAQAAEATSAELRTAISVGVTSVASAAAGRDASVDVLAFSSVARGATTFFVGAAGLAVGYTLSAAALASNAGERATLASIDTRHVGLSTLA